MMMEVNINFFFCHFEHVPSRTCSLICVLSESLDSESSDQENSSEAEHSIETEEETENEVSVGASTVVGTQERTVFLNNRSKFMIL